MAHDERGTRLLASVWCLTAAAAVLLGLRLYCKIWRGRGLWWDDHLLIIAMVSLTIAAAINTYLVSLGFGQHIDTISSDNLKTINLFTILVATFGIIATTTSKSSFAITLHRIATTRWMKHFLVFVIISINVSMNLVWIFGFAKCTPLRRVWDKSVPGTCWDPKKLVKFQLFAAYYSAILDFVLAFLPWHIIMGVSMRRRERVGVAIAMSLGAIAGITGIVKAVLVVNMTSPDITYDRVDLTIWTLTEPAASIMAISIPVLRMLYQELKSSHNRSKYNNSNPYGAQGRSANAASEARRSTRYPHGKYGQNSVVIMSNTVWEGSEEALRDSETDHQTRSSPEQSGILKTDEITVLHETPASPGKLPPQSETFEMNSRIPNRS
ncbi:hypothetical protein NLU13_1105 [Sarocladium strictum]|uniref:Rhodopsin domain-containing protein n=1 Tax=Sarocladium strictum TaxID=5046 RepID=A0AA39GQC1_SARSR|nr:hypothetical protein NLU13_1105 [Sarocladium strictum]